jgi:hypothetical protein
MDIEHSWMVRYPGKTANFCATLEIGEEGLLPNASYQPEAILSDCNGTAGVKGRDRTRFFKADKEE